MKVEVVSLFSLLLATVTNVVNSYDLMFDTDLHLNQWKFNGSYIYSRNLPDLAPLVPQSLIRSSSRVDLYRPGVWLIRYSGPEANNFLTLEYNTHHHLLVQGLLQFVGAPNVPVTVSTADGQQVAKFWSDGKTWCDGVFNIDMKTKVIFGVSTPHRGNYVLIDKIVLGVMGNLTQTNNRSLNPCKTSAPPEDSLREEDMAPDMAHHSPPGRKSFQAGSPPDMERKPAYQGPAVSQGPPDMPQRGHHHQQPASSPPPALQTSTVTNEENAVESDSSDVKCGCSCSCSRQKPKMKYANATMSSG